MFSIQLKRFRFYDYDIEYGPKIQLRLRYHLQQRLPCQIYKLTQNFHPHN